MSQKLPTILDNRDSNSVLAALKRLLPESKSLDVATGYFEIGSLLALDSFWNSLEGLRLLMGDETTKRTKNELVQALSELSVESIEKEKERDDSLRGLGAIRKAIIDGTISAKVYTKAKFHSKALLMKMKPPHLSNYGIIGSSNFTEPGLCRNVELNLLTTEQHQLEALQNWFNTHWSEAEEVKEELLRVIEPHLKEYSPFEVYTKALYEYFLGKESPAGSWEATESKMYPILDELQRIGYRQAIKIANDWGGALICDGVGFGKTYIALMIIERYLHEKKKIALLVPKSTKESVWESRLRRFFNYKRGRGYSTPIIVLSHTDLPRENKDIQDEIESVTNDADIILVDEAHNFRTRAAQRSERFYQMVEHNGRKKKLFLLTATPVNNSLFDLLHLMEYFTRDNRQYFRKLGINDTRSYFTQKERAVDVKLGLEAQEEGQEDLYPDFDIAEAEKVLRDETLFRALVIQRSRDYAKKYFKESGNGQFFFPERANPAVQPYKLAKIYGDLFKRIKESFSKEAPFLDLLLYNVEAKKKDTTKIDPKIANREKQVLMLIRATMLKRMESSYKAFESSCEDLLRNMARFVRYYDEATWEEWKKNHSGVWNTIEQHWKDRYQDETEQEDIEEDDILPEPKKKIETQELLMDEIIQSASDDMSQLADFLAFIHGNITEQQDDKLKALVDLLNSNHELKTGKVIIFTQYRDTARYLYKELSKRIKDGPIEELDSTSNKDREVVIKRFAPYYNCTEEDLPQYVNKQIRILISTDVLSEGLNLQDGHLLINYDLHWNPVRLMQRIGRVDRRLDPVIEKKLGRDKFVVRFWNFLPPDELDELLDLYGRIAGKVLRISKTLGIEGKKLLKPEDDFDALKDFNESYNGVMTFEERMRIIYAEILKTHPDLIDKLPKLPKRLFSGTKSSDRARGVFAAYRLPGRKSVDETGVVSTFPGDVRWYFHNTDTNVDLEDVEAIHAFIVSKPDTQRVVGQPMEELRKSLNHIEQTKVNAELRSMQALAGEKASLICWMEVS